LNQKSLLLGVVAIRLLRIKQHKYKTEHKHTDTVRRAIGETHDAPHASFQNTSDTLIKAELRSLTILQKK